LYPADRVQSNRVHCRGFAHVWLLNRLASGPRQLGVCYPGKGSSPLPALSKPSQPEQLISLDSYPATSVPQRAHFGNVFVYRRDAEGVGAQNAVPGRSMLCLGEACFAPTPRSPRLCGVSERGKQVLGNDRNCRGCPSFFASISGNKIAHWCPGHAVPGRGAEALEGLTMRSRAIPFESCKPVTGKLGVQRCHPRVTRNLRDDGCRGNRKAQGIAVNDGLLRELRFWEREGIQEQTVGRRREGLKGAHHCQARRRCNANVVNFSGFSTTGRYGKGVCPDERQKGFPFFGREFL